MKAEVFMQFAEIAGVYVGFGALIGARSSRVTDVHDLVYLRSVLGLGVWVVVAALVPVAVSGYGVHDHTLWLSSALAALVIWVVVLVVDSRTPETKAMNRAPEPLDRVFPLVGLPLHIIIAASLTLIILGVWRGVDEALYLTALAAGVVFAGYTLLALIMSQKQHAQPDPK
ncbi:hypothetical protein [Tessaracoccus sp. G1721]